MHTNLDAEANIIISYIEEKDTIMDVRQDFPFSEDFISKLVTENKFQKDILNKLLLSAIKEGFNDLFQTIMDIQKEEALDNDYPYAAYATKHKKYKMLEILLTKNINVNIANNADNNTTALMYAVMNNSIASIKKLIAAGANIKQRDGLGRMALHIAAEKGNIKLINALIAAGANIEERDGLGRTAFHIAAEQGNIELINKIIDKGANTKAKDYNRDTALHVAARAGKDKIIKKLITAGTNINEKNRNGDTALHVAAKKGNIKIIQIIIATGKDIEYYHDVQIPRNDEAMSIINNFAIAINNLADSNIDIEIVNKNKNKLLLCAAKQDNVDVIDKLIIGSGIDINNVKDTHGNTLLHLAINNNSINTINRLLKIDTIDTEAKNDNGNTALHLAAIFTINTIFEANANIYELLIKKSNTEAKNNKGNTPLILAIKNSNFRIINQILAKNPAIVGTIDDEGNTPLHIYAQFGCFEDDTTIKKLIDCGANIKAKNKKGYTALIFAIINSNNVTTKQLITYETNIKETDENGNTALHLAAIHGKFLNKMTIEKIIDKSEDINAKNKNGDTPLILAVKHNNIAVVTQLLNTDYIDIEEENNNKEKALTIANQTNQDISNIFYEYNARHRMSNF